MATAPKKTTAKKATTDNRAKLVKDLAKILDKTGLAELEYKTETIAIRLSRISSATQVAAAQPVTTVGHASTVAKVEEPVAASAINPDNHPGAITSPMVGTVYTAPEPGAPAFIKEGDSVSAGQTILIVEAMKVMNPITTPNAGTVVKILVQNAQPVEYGEALVIVD